MIKISAFLLFIFFGMISFAFAQPEVNSHYQQVTIEDLKPRVHYFNSKPVYKPLRKKSGLALLSSVIIPGSSQAANGKWIRAGAYILAEAVLLGVHFKSLHDAKIEQRRYKRFANSNWSVINYAKWLVEYHQQNSISNPHIEELQAAIAGKTASYTPEQDWEKVDIGLLRKVEKNTPFVYPDGTGNNFSHLMPDYGSQQYYELISKYYQYGVGWNDFGVNRYGNPLDNKYQLNWNGSDMPFNFFQGSTLAEDFNDSYRLAGNMISLIILNHIISAFDAFLTVKIKNNKLEADSKLLNGGQTFSLKYHF